MAGMGGRVQRYPCQDLSVMLSVFKKDTVLMGFFCINGLFNHLQIIKKRKKRNAIQVVNKNVEKENSLKLILKNISAF